MVQESRVRGKSTNATGTGSASQQRPIAEDIDGENAARAYDSLPP